MSKQTKDTILILLIVVLCLMADNVFSQSGKWWKPSKNDWINYGCMVGSGVSKSFNQAILFKGYGKGHSFIDKNISFKRKYKNYPTDMSEAYFGSKTFLVWTTDLWHLSGVMNTGLLLTGNTISIWNVKEEMKILPKNKRLLAFVWRKVILPIGIRGIVFETVYKNL